MLRSLFIVLIGILVVTAFVNAEPTTISSINGNSYWNGTSFTNIDTTIISSDDPLYDYMVLTGLYEFYAKDDPTTGQVVKFVYDEERVTGANPQKTGFVTYQPHSLNWRNALGQLEQISMPVHDFTLVDGNDLAYMNIYGAGVDLSYQYLDNSLKESLYVNDNESLPSPSQFIIDGGNAFLEWNFIISFDSSLEIFLDGELWDEKKTMDDVEFVEFYKDGEPLYGLGRVEAFTLDGTGYVEGWYNLKKQGNSLFISVNIPYNWLNDSETSYPLYIDPTTIATVANEWRGGDEQGNNRRVFVDYVNQRWHVIYTNIDRDVHSKSAPFSDTTTWTDGINTLSIEAVQNPEFDAIVEQRDASTTYLHITGGQRGTDTLRYIRCELTGTTPFITCGTEDTVFDASAQGGSASDDAGQAVINIDDDNCVWIAFDFEDDSLATNVEHGLTLIKENSATTCGDGDWDGAADTDSAYPIYNIQTETGYPDDFPIAIKRFDSGDFQLTWIDVTTANEWDLETVFWNESLDSEGTQNELDDDVEGNGGVYFINSVLWNETSVAISKDDGTLNIDSYVLSGKDNATSPTQVFTGLYSSAVATESQTQFIVNNPMSDGGDDLILFSRRESTAANDVGYSISPDGGFTWQNKTLIWLDNVCTGHCKYLSAAFNNETCSVLVIWQDHTSDTNVLYEVQELVLNTTGSVLSKCSVPEPAGESDSCTYISGDHTYDLTDNCVITTTVDASGNTITLNGASGSFTIGSSGYLIAQHFHYQPTTISGATVFGVLTGGKIRFGAT